MNRKVAIVTGASRGIGAAIAKRLAVDEFAVVVNYANNREKAEEVIHDIQAEGGEAIALQGDVSNAKDVESLFEKTEAIYGGVDVLVNNAGILTPQATHIADMDVELYDKIFNVNTRGTFLTLRQAARRLRVGGQIVNFSTSAVGLAMPGYAIYSGSKLAVEIFTNILAKELRGRNITVNAIAPGPTATELFYQGKSEELVEKFANQAPLERLGQPDDIASAVAFLVSPEGSWVNGQTLRVNGGIV
ncbi:SDR family oxidoreductase [Chamaesiphon polymorphus]|uniref:3-ketoacyl-ACP reductase n=1 Tax=Chamaesiphon polymorphus CCALA 037 TaxID=2107692 RepID=A0A2T1GN87_9CYAN|nr:SDR family oxidoreductase [Chamaesiphon polymorphus]PSB59362.1 3-ketoacyl-ACP reductase [Chamaesiphon polymorphus CCALA 037]